MRLLTKIVLLVLLPVIATAQEPVVTIVPSMFDKKSDQVFIGDRNGWLFKEGTDSAWRGKDIDVSGWRKLKPTGLSAKYADKNGKLEGWFRIKIIPDSSLTNFPLGIKMGTWAATDLYVDGRLLLSCGNTGANGLPYKEYSPYANPSLPVDLKPGKEYTIAVHFVDRVSPLPPFRLKSEQSGLIVLIRITGVKYNTYFLRGIKEIMVFSTSWVAICGILSLLFWLLYLQNRFERNLRLVALGSTFSTLTIFCNTSAANNIGLSYSGFMLYDYGASLFLTLACMMMPILLVTIFKRKITAALKIFLLIYLVVSVVSLFLDPSIADWINILLLCLLFAVGIYYVVSSWKNLKGAQWAIVAGLLFAVVWGLIYVFTNAWYSFDSNFVYYLSLTGYSLSFPLSLLVYVSIRFKEIIKEVQQNAKQVVQLSEEKKEQALNQQKILQEEVRRQTQEIQTTLDNLKATQSQLIQSEKMASLGQLTAGIAHEIQNPLNFVNNFSDVNRELLSEMKDEMGQGNFENAKAIADDVINNEEKIGHHGKRADAIVKGMLQHSRSRSGEKEATDINGLADEYLRLAFHGLRATDKTFNVKSDISFDKSIGKIDVVPQDIGRVLLNLINNAFYAVTEKKKQQAVGYEPGVWLTTKKLNDKVLISLRDNGTGIPEKDVDKIFQPFFTSKPTGQGTGLGLSLAYDIVKAHGGAIKVETEEGEGSEFVVELPV